MRGLRFAPIYTEMDNEERKEPHWVFAFLSVFLQVLTGVVTGVAAWIVGNCTERLGRMRLDATLSLIRAGHAGLAWLAFSGIMIAYALLAALPVIFWVVTAGSSGIPGVIGMLNGVDLRGDFTWKHLLARFAGVILSVPSGLAVGPEGPMIFVGSCIGALMSRIPSNPAVWNFFGRPPSGLNDHVYLRDYVSTGAACGIAAAFRAPIAGTLFVVEEASSHFRREHLAKIFAGSICAVLATLTLFGYRGLFEYHVATGPFCEAWQWLSLISVLFYITLGFVCGFAGALFNWLNVKVMIFRAKKANAGMPYRRVLEIVILCVLTSSLWVVLPSLYGLSGEMNSGNPALFSQGCRCIKDMWERQLVTGAKIERGELRYEPKPCLYGAQFNKELCPKAHSLARSNDPGSTHARACTQGLFNGTNFASPNKTHYCCSFETMDDLVAGDFGLPGNTSCYSVNFGESFPSLHEASVVRTNESMHGPELSEDGWYNPMASLTLVPFAEVAQNLFSRGTPHIIPPSAMLVFLIAFFILAALTAGSAIPSGLLLPMIIIGGLIGRLMALACVELQAAFGWTSNGSADTTVWTKEWQPLFYYSGGPLPDTALLTRVGWLDPGVGAVVGAAAMLGGSSRISIFLTVMIVEITGDPSMIGPVGLATLIAVVVGNRFNHGLYHSLIDVASFPFLPDRWPKTIPKALRIEHILPRNKAVVCVPLEAGREEVKERLSGNQYTGYPVVASDGVVAGLAMRHNLEALLDEADLEIDVGKVTDFHCITIRTSLPLEVAYNFFKRMENQHVIVVDDGNLPVAVLTRSSFLPWRVEEIIGELSLGRIRPTIARPRCFRTDTSDPNMNTFFREVSEGTASSIGVPDVVQERTDGLSTQSRINSTAPLLV